MAQGPVKLVEGRIVEYEARLWRVGYVNDSRARLDPLTGEQVQLANGRTFVSYGSSVNVAPTSTLPYVQEDELGDQEALIRRLTRLAVTEGNMSDTLEIGSPEVAAIPVPSRKAAKALAKVKAQVRAITGKSVKVKTDKPAKVAKAPKAKVEKPAPELKPCVCGCGEKTKGYFFPGHDARFKSWLLQIERGLDTPEKLMRKSVRESFDWKKVGTNKETGLDKLIPKTNYKGEPHTGYDSRD